MSAGLIKTSTITCPARDFTTKEEMPDNACQFFENVPNVKTSSNQKMEIAVCSVRMEMYHALRFKQKVIVVE